MVFGLGVGCISDINRNTIYVSDYCSIYKPIRWNRQTPPKVVLRIKRENAKYLDLCTNGYERK